MNAGEPDFDRLKRTQISAGWLFSHEFSPAWTFTQTYKYSQLNIDHRNVFAFVSDGDRELLRGYTITGGDNRHHYFDNRLTGNRRFSDKVVPLPTLCHAYLNHNTSGLPNGIGWRT